MEVQKAIGEYLKEHGIKQQFLVDRCGWTKQKTSNIIRCAQKITVEDVVKVCDALGLPYDYFFNMAAREKSA